MSTQSLPGCRVADILRRIVGPEVGDLSPEAARGFLRLKLDERDSQRLHEILDKNQERDLTPDERSELDDYLSVSTLMDLLRAKSFGSLKRAGLDPLRLEDE